MSIDPLGLSSTADERSHNLVPNADLRGCDFYGADLTGKDLHRANLTDASMTPARLDEANLAGTDPRLTNTTGVAFWRTTLTGANLKANISNWISNFFAAFSGATWPRWPAVRVPIVDIAHCAPGRS